MAVLAFELSLRGILEVTIAGVLVFFALRLLRRLLRVLAGKGSLWGRAHRQAPLIEAFVWVFFVWWASGLVLSDPRIRSWVVLTGLVVGVVWLTWFAARDFVAGIVLRLQGDYEHGRWIRVGSVDGGGESVEGSIGKVGFLGIVVDQDDGARAHVPYSRLAGSIHSILAPETTGQHSFEIRVRKGPSLADAVDRVREGAMMSPWSSPTREPRIQRVSETAEEYTFEVAVYGPGRAHLEAVERDVRRYLDRAG